MGKAAKPLPPDACFHGGAQTAVFRSAWGDPRALFLGFKAGSNSVNHAHLDLGSFVLESDGVRWAVDLGRDDYNLAEYFGPERWSVFRLNNLSHNTLGFGHDLQAADAIAPIVRFSSTPERAVAVADLSAALHHTGVKATRSVAMLDRARILMQDDLQGLGGQPPLSWRMLSEARITLSPDGRVATLRQKNRTLQAEVLSPADAKFSLRPATPPDPQQNQNSGVQILEVEYQSKNETLRLSVLFTPVGEQWPKLPAPPALD